MDITKVTKTMETCTHVQVSLGLYIGYIDDCIRTNSLMYTHTHMGVSAGTHTCTADYWELTISITIRRNAFICSLSKCSKKLQPGSCIHGKKCV